MPKKTQVSPKSGSKDEKSSKRETKDNSELIETTDIIVNVVEDGENTNNLKNSNKNSDKPPDPGETAPAPAEPLPSQPEPIRPDSIDTSVLKDLLECPVCLRVPRSSPIFQCARGHVVCAECKPNVNTCPICRDVLGNIRSLVSEKVLEKLPAPCKYSDTGCEVELMRSELPSHQKKCKYRSVNCVDLACQQPVSLVNLLNHIDNDHETEDFVRVEGGEYSSHFIVNEEDFNKDIMWISDQLHFDQKYFYRECCRSNKGLWYIWVYQLDTSSPADSNYTCEISVLSADRQEVLSCKSRPLSLDYTKEKVADSGRGLVFTDSTARLFWEENKVRYSVSIKPRDSKNKEK